MAILGGAQRGSTGVSLLLIEDDKPTLDILSEMLRKHSYDVTCALTFEAGQDEIHRSIFDVIVTDLRLPDGSGLDLLRLCRQIRPDTPVILATGFATIRNAVEAIRDGAFDYLTKPVQFDELLVVVDRAIDVARIKEQNRFLKEQVRTENVYLDETSDAVMSEVYRLADSVSTYDSTVLITGESGTGKEVVARRIHDRSPRSEGTFVPINCGAIPDGLIESELFGFVKGAFTDAKETKKGRLEIANGGTLFLDEVNELSPRAQVVLLRFIEQLEITPIGSTKKTRVNARIICATNANLKARVTEGSFREDLYYRIGVIPVELPPLRERRNDIVPLANWFLDHFGNKYNKRGLQLSDAAAQRLLEYGWPGNIRELRNTMERAVIITPSTTIEARTVTISDGSEPKGKSFPFDNMELVSLKELQTRYVAWVYEKMKNNKTKTAKVLGVSARSLYEKI